MDILKMLWLILADVNPNETKELVRQHYAKIIIGNMKYLNEYIDEFGNEIMREWFLESFVQDFFAYLKFYKQDLKELGLE